MDEENISNELHLKQVAANLYNKGDYFQNAREWFYQKYLLQYRLRSIFVIVSLFICILTFLSFYLVVAELSAPKVLSGVVQNNLDQRYPIKIHQINKASSRHSDKVIAQILIEDFIKKVESFNYKNKEREMDIKNQIFNSGTVNNNIIKIFQNRFESVYIPSYISGYERKIEIKSFVYQDPEESLYYKIRYYFTPSQIGNRAQVHFKVYYISKLNTIDFEEEYNANIVFFFRPIRKINNDFSKIKFYIEDYNLQKIK